ncbi:MAG: hypothetical protein JXA21_20670 [Anaerolineae bacterium]|nr:hypothetical protein [Anaerolineae bacterium]
MNVYEVLIANAGDVNVVLVEASHIGVAVGRAVRRKRSVPRDLYLKVLARRVAVGMTVEEYKGQKTVETQQVPP